MNKTFLKGNLTKDAEVRYTTAGKPVVSFSIATNERWLDQASNDWKEKAEYHNVVLFDRHAKLFADGNNISHLQKGATVIVEGKNQTRSWDGQQGEKRYTTEVVVDVKGSIEVAVRIKMTSAQQGQQQQYQQPQQQQPQQYQQQQPQQYQQPQQQQQQYRAQQQQQPQQQQYQAPQQQQNYRDLSQSFAD